MRQVEFVPFRLTEDAEIFSIRIDGKGHTEFQKFLIALKDVDNKYLQHDLKQILNSLNEIGQHGVKEYFFRPEGKMKDRVCAIPLLTIPRRKSDGTLRLYCIRISEKLLIIGGGGIKTTQTYNADITLSQHVDTLQKIDKVLSDMENESKNIHKEIYNTTIQID
ncbi:MAG: hypothetical protein E7111_09595 [Bacteroidales bacterium]|nr:hypothetical protein [Bacteroidales bacterium]